MHICEGRPARPSLGSMPWTKTSTIERLMSCYLASTGSPVCVQASVCAYGVWDSTALCLKHPRPSDASSLSNRASTLTGFDHAGHKLRVRAGLRMLQHVPVHVWFLTELPCKPTILAQQHSKRCYAARPTRLPGLLPDLPPAWLAARRCSRSCLSSSRDNGPLSVSAAPPAPPATA
jgi:hypothetical protein